MLADKIPKTDGVGFDPDVPQEAAVKACQAFTSINEAPMDASRREALVAESLADARLAAEGDSRFAPVLDMAEEVAAAWAAVSYDGGDVPLGNESWLRPLNGRAASTCTDAGFPL